MKSLITKLLLTAAFVAIPATAGCTLLQSMFEDKVVTTSDNVKEGELVTAVPIDLNLLNDKIPEDVRKRLEQEGKTVVIVPKDAVKDPQMAVEITSPGENALDAIVGIGLGVANTVFPGIAALEGLGLLFSQRKRQHYAAAAKAALPTDGSVDLKEAMLSVVRGMGLAHSSTQSKEAFKKEA